MANVGLGWPNWVDVAATFSGGTWETALPRPNLADARLAAVARSVGLTTAATQFDVDLGAARVVGVVALIRTTLTAAATVRVRGASDAGFTSVVYDSGTVAAFPEAWPTGLLPTGHPNAATRLPTTAQLRAWRWDVNVLPPAVSARYWRVELSDATNPAGHVDVGRLWIAPLYQPSINPRYGAEYGFAAQSVTGRALSGTRYVDVRPNARTRTFEFADLPPAEAQQVLGDLVRTLDLGGQVYVIDDPADAFNRQRGAFLATLTQLPAVVRASFVQGAVTLALEEVL
jgi:hypothetical protein